MSEVEGLRPSFEGHKILVEYEDVKRVLVWDQKKE